MNVKPPSSQPSQPGDTQQHDTVAPSSRVLIRVLLIEDDEDDHYIIRKLLSKIRNFDYEIKWVDTVTEAVAAIQTGVFDTVLTDYQLRDGTGLDVIRKAVQANKNLPLIMLTGNQDPRIDEASMGIGADDFLPKEELTGPLLSRTIRHSIFRKRTEQELRESEDRNRELAEFSSAVLHNIGNVLNSVNVSTGRVVKNLRESKITSLEKTKELLEANKDNPDFLSQDPKGRMLPPFLVRLAELLQQEHQQNLTEAEKIRKGLGLMKEVIKTQQTHAKHGMELEDLDLREVISDALNVNMAALMRHRIEVQTLYHSDIRVQAQKVKLTHIMINLIKNSIEAMAEVPESQQRTIKIELGENDRRQPMMTIQDRGHGVEAAQLKKIFDHGFTTKQRGHGFGLNYCFKTMRELGGSIHAESEGPDTGTKFVLTFPFGTLIDD